MGGTPCPPRLTIVSTRRISRPYDLIVSAADTVEGCAAKGRAVFFTRVVLLR
jgi:hypothetical protein